MIIKMKLTAAQRRAGVDLRNVIGHRTDGTPFDSAPKKRAPKKTPKKRAPSPEFRAIEFVETLLHDPVRDQWEPGCDEGGVRLWCTSSPDTHGKDNGRWSLQVRAQVKRRGGGSGNHFAVGTASMSREDLLWLRAKIDEALRE
jgi:hypothetical protein